MSKKGLRARLPTLIGAGVMLLLVAGLIYMIKSFIDSAEKPAKNRVQQISLVKPPPPKPPEEKPPEPVKQEIKEEVHIDQPNPQPAESPPAEELTTTQGPGNDNFGMKGGDGGGTRIGGGGGSRARWYAGLLGARIEQTLNRDTKLLDILKAKRITVRIWVGSSGNVERVEWDKGVVPAGAEKSLREQLLALSVQEAPDGVEQPIWYRFRPRG